MGIEIIKKENEAEIIVSETSLIGLSVENLKKDALELIEDGFKTLTINLEKTNYIDSSGIGKLLFINKKAISKGTLLRINSISPTLLDFFESLSIDKIIPILKK